MVIKEGHMNKIFCRLSGYMLILLVLTIPIGFWQVTGQAEDQPAGETSGSDQSPSIMPEGMSEMFKGTVVEVVETSRHIYVHIDTGEQRVWVAVPVFDGKPGDKVIVPPGIPVADFQSRKLNRRFKMIYFVGGLRKVEESPSN
jgi:hypothetical protein